MNLNRFMRYFANVQSFEPDHTKIRFADETGRNLAIDMITFDVEANAWTVQLKPAPIADTAPINGAPAA